MGKSPLEIEVHELDVDHKRQHGSGDAVAHELWQPGYVKRFPATAAASLLAVVLTAIGCALILYSSNNTSSSQWPSIFRPNVAVSLLNAVGNMALMTALSQGIPIAWWIKAVEGATISQLHQSWISSSSFTGVMANLFRLDIIGFAVLVAKISVIDSVLYQRATTTYIGQDTPKIVPMLGVAATTFPSTGIVVAEGFGAQTLCGCFMIGDEYTSVVNTWQTSNGFFRDYNRYFQECNGVCYTHIDAVGFEIDCDMNVNQTDIAAIPIQAYSAAGGAGNNSAAWTDIPIFNSSFFLTYADGTHSNQTVINLDLQYFQSSNPFNPSGETCQGTLTTVQCKLRPALVRYPITITNFTNPHVTNGVSLGSLPNTTSSADNLAISNPNIQPYLYDLKQANGFEVLSYLYPNETAKLNSISYLGGLANALHMGLTSTAAITYQGSGTWALSQTGVLSQTMMFGPPNMGSCDCSFRDESLSAIVAGINQLAFLTSTGMIDQKLIPFPTATSSNLSSSFLFPVSNPVLSVNTSTPLIIQGVASNSTTFFRSLDGTLQVSDVSFHQTHFLFLGLGVGITLLCVVSTMSLFWRYGTLGREVSLGPIEVAGAFGAPILSHTPTESSDPDEPKMPIKPQSPRSAQEARSRDPAPISMNQATLSNPPSPLLQTPTTVVTFANINDLLATVGDRKVLYGVVDVEHNDDQGISHDDGTMLSPLLTPTSAKGPNSASKQRKSRILTFGDAAGGRVKPAPRSPTTNASIPSPSRVNFLNT